jgi:hypothetical protein
VSGLRALLTKYLTNRWMNDSIILAQIGHALGGYSIVLTVAFLWRDLHRALIAAGLVMLYATIKEHWYDANYEEPKQTSWDNWLDWSFYLVGSIIGTLLTWWRLS